MISLKRHTPRILQVTIGLAVLCAFAVMPVAANAAESTTALNGEVNAGALSVVAPLAIAMPAVSVTGTAQTATQEVKGWQFADLTGKEEGYAVVVSAPSMKIGSSEPYTITLKSHLAEAKDQTAEKEAESNNAPENKAAAGETVTESGATIQEAAPAKGNGLWEVPAEPAYLEIGIPAVTPSGLYSNVLTFTISAGV